MNIDYDLTEINRTIFNCISRACIGAEPLEALIVEGSFIPKESLLWDYKESISSESLALAKTVLQIVSFHNTCGGYLVYGVKEIEKDKEFSPANLDFSQVDPAQLRNKIKHFTGRSIDITFKEVNYSLKGEGYNAGVIFIPKREKTSSPVSFIKNGPEKRPGKPLFCPDETYFRHLDECVKATTASDWQTLFSSREFNPSYGLNNKLEESDLLQVTHNLPDKNLICATFVGRDSLLSRLWEWLSDDLEYTKILSGDGGKGKTSIAYQFCRTFIQSSPSGYERVVWLSAKEKQFSGIHNEYFELQESDFNSCHSFLLLLIENCAMAVEEYEDVSTKQLKRDLKDSLPLFPSIYVVDDIDSLEEDEQRKVVDACRQLGSSNTRYLITTRKKLAYSSDLCIDVPGFPIDDFTLYVDSLVSRYSLASIKKGDVASLHKTCDGSPLLAASILRLYKQGVPFSQAIREWKGEAGEDARSAALKREITSLTPESKRVLLAIFYFVNCSFTELKQSVGIERIKLIDCLEELQSLFLVNEPKLIDSEDRYSISNTTALIISEIQKEMAFDHRKLSTTIKSMKEGPSVKKIGNTRKVGIAINQSLALIRDGRIPEAIETVDQQLRFLSENPDLLLMKARCISRLDSPDYTKVRELLRRSYGKGQRKELLFDLWFKTESSLNSSNGIIEVSQLAIKIQDFDKTKWLERLATGLVLRSKHRDVISGLQDLMDASLALTKSLNYLDRTSKEIRIEELNSLHNIIWNKLELSNNHSWLTCFDMILDLLKRGDVRTKMFINASRCLAETRAEGIQTEKKKNAYNRCVDRFLELLDDRPEKDKHDRPFSNIRDELCEI
ncbi:Divergent AAA domain protein [Halomonas chromatireducens]|uniref:Divergent AAA domain protein n=2 Tax=Halomonas chromatireducens TaxID=507626 RepID=A0A0X8HFC1_9GAMM|nr:Divergent AAA domain protein [Halomonas chromatireducens]